MQLLVKVVKRPAPGGPSAKRWHAEVDGLADALAASASPDIGSIHKHGSDLWVHCKSDKGRQRILEQLKVTVGKNSELASRALVLLARPGPRAAMEKPANIIYGWVRQQLNVAGGRPALSTLWPAVGRPNWAVLGTESAAVAVGTLKGGTAMRIEICSEWTTNGICMKGKDLLAHLDASSTSTT